MHRPTFPACCTLRSQIAPALLQLVVTLCILAYRGKHGLPPLGGSLNGNSGTLGASGKRPKVGGIDRSLRESALVNVATMASYDGQVEEDYDGELRTGNDVIEYYVTYVFILFIHNFAGLMYPLQ